MQCSEFNAIEVSADYYHKYYRSGDRSREWEGRKKRYERFLWVVGALRVSNADATKRNNIHRGWRPSPPRESSRFGAAPAATASDRSISVPRTNRRRDSRSSRHRVTICNYLQWTNMTSFLSTFATAMKPISYTRYLKQKKTRAYIEFTLICRSKTLLF